MECREWASDKPPPDTRLLVEHLYQRVESRRCRQLLVHLQELGRLVSYAESAYEKVSNDLKHEISFAIPLILYKTFSEFAQTNLYPLELPEGVGFGFEG